MGALLDWFKRPDTQLHFKGGALVALFFLVECMLVAKGFPGTAIAAGASLLLIGFEWYQVEHDKGTGEWGDVIAGSIFSWLTGGLVGLYGLPTL